MTDYRATDNERIQMEETQKLPEGMLENMLTAEEGNNNPDIPLDSRKLGIDEFLVDRLTKKAPEKYKFRKSIACGGMKVVLAVRDMDTMRDVAMAVLPDTKKRPPSEVLRFVQEARLTASLEHPNIVPVHDIGIDANGAPYFTMKLLRGKTLAAYLTTLRTECAVDPQKPYPLDRLLRIFLKICSGTAFAHSKGVIHLDLKPENIQLGDFGEVLIIDWGLAKMIDKETEDAPEDAPSNSSSDHAVPLVTMNGIAKGTPGYMAPEQAAGLAEHKDERTDIYALGAILYAMLTGVDPIEKKPVRQMLDDTLRGKIVPPHLRVPEKEIPAALEAVVMKAMSRNPSDRYASVVELRDEVNAFIGGYATKAEQASLLKKAVLLVKRHAVTASVLTLFTFFLTTALFFTVREQKRRNAAWQPLCNVSFQSKNDAPLQCPGMYFLDHAFQPITWYSGKNGLLLPEDQWMVLNYPVSGDWRLELLFIPETNQENFEVRFDTMSQESGGFLCRFGADGGSRDVFSLKGGGIAGPVSITGTQSCLVPGSVRRILFLHENGKLLCRTGMTDRPICLAEFLPPDLNPGKQIAIRAFTGGVRFLTVKFSEGKAPERTTPLIGAEALMEEHLYKPAMNRYLRIAKMYENTSFCDEALLRAYQIAALYLPESAALREKRIGDIKKRITLRRNFLYADRIHEIDAVSLWSNGQFLSALEIAEALLKTNPESDILLRLAGMSRRKLPGEAAGMFLRLIRKMNRIHALDLSGLGLTSLLDLRGLPLHYLDCSGNDLKDLSGLERMPLCVLVTDNGVFNTPADIREEIRKSLERENAASGDSAAR